MEQQSKNILFCAGGTGGHVIPAYVLAKEISEKFPHYNCVFVGAKGKFEQNWIPKQGFDVELLKIGGVKSGSFAHRILSFCKIPMALIDSYKILKKYKPDRVFGIGGYTSGPIMLLATLFRIPSAILEPNAVAGFSNRILSRFVKRVYIVFEGARNSFPTKKVKNFGHLIRKPLLEIQPPDFSQDKKTIAIFGGSQGSMKINHVFCEMLKKYEDYLKQEINIIHQTGPRDFEHIQKCYEGIEIQHQVAPFFEEMDEIYKKTHLIIARSGSSIVEFASIGIPSILIPLSIAADNHQFENAKSLKNTGGVIIIDERTLCPEKLFEELMQFLRADLKAMSLQLRDFRKENAVKDIMEDFLAIR